MRSRVEFDELVHATKDRIKSFVDRLGLSRVYSAYSGGKDSQAVLHLTRSVFPNILAVHNQHPGEVLDRQDVLVVKPPKLENVPQFLKTVDLVGQIDGTRRDEDKLVFFGGGEIHRSQMPGYETSRGVFGLECLFPLWDWTEEDVFRYLNGLPGVWSLFRDFRVGYEGEGPWIGKKTLYCRYPGGIALSGELAGSFVGAKSEGGLAFYVTADYLTPGLMETLLTGSDYGDVTIEIPMEQVSGADISDIKNALWFVRCVEYQVKLVPQPNLFIKIEIQPSDDWAAKLCVANQFAADGHKVLLMPIPGNRDAEAIGKDMMKIMPAVQPNVRVMPPVHKLLGIP